MVTRASNPSLWAQAASVLAVLAGLAASAAAYPCNQQPSAVELGWQHGEDVLARQASVGDDPGDAAALIDLAKHLNVNGWRNHGGWLSSASVCQWYGITCSSGRVTEIDLHQNNLLGTIPCSVVHLTKLQEFYISGDRPASYSGCTSTNLQYSGLPETMYTLTDLSSLLVEYSCLGGKMSPAIGNLTQLQTFIGHGNRLTGPIPAELNSCTKLQFFKMGRNALSGQLPAITKLQQLVKFNCNFCSLTGTFPDVLDTMPKLVESYWDGNGFHGSLPTKLPASLQSLSFNINNFTGAVPDAFCEHKLNDCRIGADTALAPYQANYPWIQHVSGNMYTCPVPSCARKGGWCNMPTASPVPSPVECRNATHPARAVSPGHAH